MVSLSERASRAVGAIAIIGATTLLSGCYSGVSRAEVPPPSTSAAARGPGEPASWKAQWASLSPFEKFQRLEQMKYPQSKDFDFRRELLFAAADFYCSQTKCEKPADKMVEDVSFLSPEKFMEEIENDAKTKESIHTDEVKALIAKGTIMTTLGDGRIIVNSSLLDKYLGDLFPYQPNKPKEPLFKSRVIVQRSMLFHELSHVNESEEVYVMDPPVVVGNRRAVKMEGFEVTFKNANGTTTFDSSPKEIMAETAADIIGRRSGKYFLNSQYAARVKRLLDHNKTAEISEDEFLAVQRGELPIGVLFEKWGQSLQKDKGDLLPDEVLGRWEFLRLTLGG